MSALPGTMTAMTHDWPVTPPPWRWLSVRLGPAGGDAAPTSRGSVLVAEDGTVLVLAGNYLRLPEVDPVVLGLLSRAWTLEQVPGLEARWEAFREATDPVEQANLKIEFDDAFFRFTQDATVGPDGVVFEEGLVEVADGELDHPAARLTGHVARLVRELEEAYRHAKATAVWEPVERALSTATLLRDLITGQRPAR